MSECFARKAIGGLIALLVMLPLPACSSEDASFEGSELAGAEDEYGSGVRRDVSAKANSGLTLDDIPDGSIISIEELKGKLDSDSDLFVLDIRNVRAYVEGHIADSVNIPAGGQLELRIEEVPLDKEIVIVSQFDERLGESWQTLVDAGCDPGMVKVAEGGISAWESDGYPLKEKEVRSC